MRFCVAQPLCLVLPSPPLQGHSLLGLTLWHQICSPVEVPSGAVSFSCVLCLCPGKDAAAEGIKSRNDLLCYKGLDFSFRSFKSNLFTSCACLP